MFLVHSQQKVFAVNLASVCRFKRGPCMFLCYNPHIHYADFICTRRVLQATALQQHGVHRSQWETLLPATKNVTHAPNLPPQKKRMFRPRSPSWLDIVPTTSQLCRWVLEEWQHRPSIGALDFPLQTLAPLSSCTPSSPSHSAALPRIVTSKNSGRWHCPTWVFGTGCTQSLPPRALFHSLDTKPSTPIQL